MSLALPNQNITTSDARPATGAPLDSTRLLIAMECDRGTTQPMKLSNANGISKALATYTGKNIPAWDVAEVAFLERVPEVWLARIVGPAAAGATINLLGPGGQPALSVTANEVGAWANGAAAGLKAQVTNGPNGAGERVIVFTLNGQPYAQTPAFTVRADALAYNNQQTALRVALGTENALPVVAAAANFAGGTDDAGAITSTQVDAALRRVALDKGPMQVVIPGRNTDAINQVLLQYVKDFDRTALGEFAAMSSVASIVTSCGVLRALGDAAGGLATLGGFWTQQAIGPGRAPGSTRQVPWSIIVAGLIARAQANAGHPNVAPFEDQGVPLWATDVDRYFTQAEAETLYGAGCNVAKSYLDAPRNATFHTLANPDTSQWEDLGHTRTERQIRAEGRDVGRQMGSRVINRSTVNEFGAKLGLRLNAMAKAGALYYDTDPTQAYRVDTDTTNDSTTMRAKAVNAGIGAVMAEHAEYVNIDLAKVQIGQEV